MLRTYRSKITITIPWRPFYHGIRKQYLDPLPAYTGSGPCMSDLNSAVGCLSRMRSSYGQDRIWQTSKTTLHKLPCKHDLSAWYAGPTVSEMYKDALTKVVHRSRRFFPAGAASEIWAEFRPDLQNIHRANIFEVSCPKQVSFLHCLWCLVLWLPQVGVASGV